MQHLLQDPGDCLLLEMRKFTQRNSNTNKGIQLLCEVTHSLAKANKWRTIIFPFMRTFQLRIRYSRVQTAFQDVTFYFLKQYFQPTLRHLCSLTQSIHGSEHKYIHICRWIHIHEQADFETAFSINGCILCNVDIYFVVKAKALKLLYFPADVNCLMLQNSQWQLLWIGFRN